MEKHNMALHQKISTTFMYKKMRDQEHDKLQLNLKGDSIPGPMRLVWKSIMQ
jgi:hypothetical protein